MSHFFTTYQEIILVKLITLHFVNDFMLQPTSWVKHRNENGHLSSRLYIHGMIAGLTAYVAFWSWAAWPVLFVVASSHIVVDLLKTCNVVKWNNLILFLTDQALHLLILLGCWLFWVSGFSQAGQLLSGWMSNYQLLLIILGYVTCIFPLGYVVSFGTEQWRKQIPEPSGSLTEAGKWIGMIERALVFTLVLLGKFEAIGLIITAKSILRFSDVEVRKHSEYVLIGTFISFSLAIVVGFLIKYLIA